MARRYKIASVENSVQHECDADGFMDFGLGLTGCSICKAVEWDNSGSPYADIITVDRARGTAYLAVYSGIPLGGTNSWTMNCEAALVSIDALLGFDLPDGPQADWVRIPWTVGLRGLSVVKNFAGGYGSRSPFQVSTSQKGFPLFDKEPED